jgi:hypothetical protein
MLRLIGVVLLVGVLAGCGVSPVREISPSTYVVTSQHGALDGSWDKAQQEAISKANEYCSSKGLAYAFVNEQRAGVVGWSPQSSTITFTCGQDTAALRQAAQAQCNVDYQTHELDPIRDKIEIVRMLTQNPVPFAIATNDSFPTNEEKKAIGKWATLREECIKRVSAATTLPPSASPIQITQIQQDMSFEQAMTASISDLIVSLYQQKLTYGEFAKKRYEISNAAADAERQFRLSVQIGDQQKQEEAKRMAQQQFQNNLMAWSVYQQSLNARQPQTVHLDGSARLQSNCISQRVGNMVSTNCN